VLIGSFERPTALRLQSLGKRLVAAAYRARRRSWPTSCRRRGRSKDGRGPVRVRWARPETPSAGDGGARQLKASKEVLSRLPSLNTHEACGESGAFCTKPMLPQISRREFASERSQYSHAAKIVAAVSAPEPAAPAAPDRKSLELRQTGAAAETLPSAAESPGTRLMREMAGRTYEVVV